MATGNEIAETLRGMVDRDMTFMHIAKPRGSDCPLGPPQRPAPAGENGHRPRLPVLYTPQGEIDAALDLVEKDCIIATYGDCPVPGFKGYSNPAAGMCVIYRVSTRRLRSRRRLTGKCFHIRGFETTAQPLPRPSFTGQRIFSCPATDHSSRDEVAA